MTNVLSFHTSGPDFSRPAVHLTPRQLDVLKLLCTGEPNKVIGRQLGIASATVKVHVSSILRMLKVDSRLQAVLKAHELGLVPAEAGARRRSDESGDDDRLAHSASPKTPSGGSGSAGAVVRFSLAAAPK